MSAAVMHKRNHSELSQAGEQEQPPKAAKTEQAEQEFLEDAQAKMLELEQTIELARTSLKFVIEAFQGMLVIRCSVYFGS